MTLGVIRSPRAQQENPLTILGPFGAGGLNDVVARMYANKVAPLLKRTVIVGKKPGAGGLIAAQTVLRGSPEASLLVVSNTFLTAAHVYKNPGYLPIKDSAPAFRTLKDLVAVMAGEVDIAVDTPFAAAGRGGAIAAAGRLRVAARGGVPGHADGRRSRVWGA